MEIWEMNVKMYLLKDIEITAVLEQISKLIDKSFLHDQKYRQFHQATGYKGYCFNSLYPLAENKIYQKERVYSLVIRTVTQDLAQYLNEYLVNEYTDALKVLTITTKKIPQKHIREIYSITPAVLKIEGGYWRTSHDLDFFEKRLTANMIKKYNQFYNTKLNEDFEFFTNLRFENKKPITSTYKNIRLLGDKISLHIAENENAQKLAHLAIGCGILENNSRGYGFVNYKWL